MENENQGQSRRASDVQIPVLAAKVGALEAETENLRESIRHVDAKVEESRAELSRKLDGISEKMDSRTRIPLLPHLSLLVAGSAVLITLGVQAIHGQAAVHSANFQQLQAQLHDHQELGIRHKAEFREHIKDGHSASVREILAQSLDTLDRRISVVDEQHSLENIEQEEDIEALRVKNSEVETRLDDYLERMAKMEAKFGRVVGHSKEGFHQKDARQVIGPLRDRIQSLEARVRQ